MSLRNRLHNCSNGYQGRHKRVLCVCSAGLLRSPTIAWVLSQPPYSYNTRAVGYTAEYALIPLDPVHIAWADEVVCADDLAAQACVALGRVPDVQLNLPDIYAYRDPELVALIEERYAEFARAHKES